MKLLSFLLLSFLLVLTANSDAQKKPLNVLELRQRQFYTETSKIHSSSPLNIHIAVKFDRPNWYDEESTLGLWISIKNPPVVLRTTSYDIARDTNQIKCNHYITRVWVLDTDIWVKEGTITITAFPDSTVELDLNLRFTDSTSHVESVYRGKRKLEKPSAKKNETFERSKGMLPTPVADYKKIVNNDTLKYGGVGVSFICNRHSYVSAVFDGEVVSVSQIDSSYYFLISRFGDYYLVYDQLTKPFFKKGDRIKQGMPIAQASYEGEMNAEMSIFLMKDNTLIPIYDWFRRKLTPLSAPPL